MLGGSRRASLSGNGLEKSEHTQHLRKTIGSIKILCFMEVDHCFSSSGRGKELLPGSFKAV